MQEGEEEDGDYEWILDRLCSNQINNLNMYDCALLFEGDVIPLPEYDLIMITTMNGKKNFEMFRILEGGGSTFFGIHKIQWKGIHYYIPNLSTLKRNFFQFKDKLTFERCTFLVLHGKKKLVRLKNVRSMIKYPLVPSYCGITVHTSPNESKLLYADYKYQKPLSENSFIRQKRKYQDLLVTAYKRHFPEKSLHELCSDIQEDYKQIFESLKEALDEKNFLAAEIAELLK